MSEETISTIDLAGETHPRIDPPPGPDAAEGPLDWLPRYSARQVRVERWLSVWTKDGQFPAALEWLQVGCGGSVVVDRPEVFWRASGLNRPGMIAHLTAPTLGTRLAIGIENALAHSVVDRLLGYDRAFGETRHQLTPVEWGIWTFLVLRALDALDSTSIRLDRAGPDPFDPTGLGALITVRWGVRIGTVSGSVRLWIPEAMARPWFEATGLPGSARPLPATGSARRDELAASWRALAGTIDLRQGLKRLKVGGVLPLTETRLSGTPGSPDGPIELVVDLDDSAGRLLIPARPVADSGGRLIRLEGSPRREPGPREPILVPAKETRPMSQPTAPNPTAPDASPLDVPVTLAVELGRVNLTLSRLADLKPGDVVELGRHSRAPVELTSNGRLVARGELILIDTDLGVRVTSVFL